MSEITIDYLNTFVPIINTVVNDAFSKGITPYDITFERHSGIDWPLDPRFIICPNIREINIIVAGYSSPLGSYSHRNPVGLEGITFKALCRIIIGLGGNLDPIIPSVKYVTLDNFTDLRIEGDCLFLTIEMS